jgi:YtkA-like
VLAGLKAGERVASNGNFLIDSQTRLSGGMTGLFGGSKEFANHDHQQPEKLATNTEQQSAAKLVFSTDPKPLKGAAPNTFHAQLTDAAGKPITDAQMKVTVVMPAMPAMNMPEMRATGDLAWNGNEYEGRVNVPIAGVWNVTIEAMRKGQTIARAQERRMAN